MLLFKLFVILLISFALCSANNGVVTRQLNELTPPGRDSCPLLAVIKQKIVHPGMMIIPRRKIYKPNDMLVIQCDTNNEKNAVKCLPDGRWNKEIDCPFPTSSECKASFSILNGKSNASLSTYPIGARIRFTCDDGYDLEGPQIITCRANNKWTARVPQCIPNVTKECILDVQLSNGHHNGSTVKYPIGTSIKFDCNDGYLLEGDDLITCSTDKKWTSNVPNCSSTQHQNRPELTVSSSSSSTSSTSSSSSSPSSLSKASKSHFSFVLLIFFTFSTIFILIGLISLYRWRQRRAKRKYWKSYFDNNAYRQSKTTITANTDHHVQLFLNWETPVPVTDL